MIKWLFLSFSLSLFLTTTPTLAEEELILDMSSDNKPAILKEAESLKMTPVTSTPYAITPRVDVITGTYMEGGADFIVEGCEPLSVRKFYCHSAPYEPRYGGWQYNPETFAAANLELYGEPTFVAIGDEEGQITSYESGTWQGHGTSSPISGTFGFSIDKQKSYVNTQGGQNHPLNTKISFQRKNAEWFEYGGEIIDGDGRKRSFNTPNHPWVQGKKVPIELWMNGHKTKMNIILKPILWTPYALHIFEERKPNGNILCYSYEKWRKEEIFPNYRLLSSITAYNSTKTKVLGSIKFRYWSPGGNIMGLEATGSDGRKTLFIHEDKKHPLLASVTSPNNPVVIYKYKDAKLASVEKPDGRIFKTEYKDNKVSAQYAPVGPNGELCCIGRYTYLDGATEVIDAEGNKIIYRFNDKKISAVENYLNNKLYRIDRYNWEAKTGNLLSKTTEDSQGKLFAKEEYLHDKNHNVIEEKIGEGTESYSTYYTYSDDGFNLKLSEKDDFGKSIKYAYVKGTNLLSSEFVYDGNTIIKRAFNFYDDCAVCIKTIVDDGRSEDPNDLRSVTFRKIVVIKPKNSQPCFGLPEILEERTINSSGQEILLSKVTYTYTPFGKVLKEEHYDSTNTFRYAIQNEYNSNETLLYTIDALGQKSVFFYDRNNNLGSLSKDTLRKEWTYDKADRPIQEKDDNDLKLKKRYDKLGRVIATIDESGFETKYQYDALGRLTTLLHPDGACERKEYDLLGNVIKETDAKGYETCKKYNFRGQPISITHPDKAEEHFSYRADGQLLSSIDRNRAKKGYVYDLFGHLIQEKVYSSSGGLLKTTSATYSPFCQLSLTNAEGVVTTHTYDYAGRKLSTKTASQHTFFFYDTLGRLTKTQSGDTFCIEEYDLLNRPIEKRIEDTQNTLHQKENYAYNPLGHRNKVITSKGVSETLYNTRGEPIEIKDALGHTTKISYIYDKGLIKTVTNPKGIQRISCYDCRGREKETTILNAKKEPIQKTTRKFDANGNQIETTEHVFENTTPTKTLINTWTYGPSNRIESLLESGEKKTTYLYDEEGRLKTLIKPDGTPLNHVYDDLGRLSQYSSSGFHYLYTYDRCDRPTFIFDIHSKTTTQRSYDALGNILQEKIGNDLVLTNSYDDQGRRISLILPDTSEISYTYKASYLYQVTRKNQTHTYTKRDLEGHLIQADLPANLGSVHIERDALSRWRQCTSAYFTALFPEDAFDVTGNLCHYNYVDSLGAADARYTYDDLDQLISENEHTYFFDSLNNRLRKDNTTYAINTLNQIVGFTYDANGNMLSDKESVFTYDSQDRLIKVKKGTLEITYTYDPFHRRLSKKVYDDGDEIMHLYYLWDGNNEIGATDKKGRIQQLRVLGEGLGAEIGASVLMEIGGKTYIPLHDHRGCVITLIDSKTQTPKETYRYTSFGEETTGHTFSPWGFVSKRIEQETNLLFFGRRYYSPALGRWITTDPQGFSDGPNLYAYVHNNPLTHFDLYGLWENPYSGTQNIGGAFRRTMYGVFRGIQLMGMHLIPMAGVRDLVESVGRWGTGGKFFELCEYRKNQNQVYTIPGKQIPGTSFFYKNGIMTNPETAKAQAQEQSIANGGVQTDVLYNASQGFLTDLIATGLAKLGMVSSTERMTANYFLKKLEQDPGHKFVGNVHSQGATHLMNAGKLMKYEQRQRIEVNAFGPATIIPEKAFGKAENYISRLDLVSMTSTFRYIKAVCGGSSNVHFLTPTTMNPLKEHFMDGTYGRQMTKLGQDFVDKYR